MSTERDRITNLWEDLATARADVERLLDELIADDPDRAERFIESHLARVALRKRLPVKLPTASAENVLAELDRYLDDMSSPNYRLRDSARPIIRTRLAALVEAADMAKLAIASVPVKNPVHLEILQDAHDVLHKALGDMGNE